MCQIEQKARAVRKHESNDGQETHLEINEAVMSESSFKELANVKVGARIKQIVVLVVAIIVGILLSKSSDAVDFKGASTNIHRIK